MITLKNLTMKLALINLARKFFKIKKNNIMPELLFVIPGLYKSKSSTKENPDIIKVYGESPDNPGFFLTGDNKLMSESDLLTNYDFMPSVAGNKDQADFGVLNKRKNIFRDKLDDIKPVVQVDEQPIDPVTENIGKITPPEYPGKSWSDTHIATSTITGEFIENKHSQLVIDNSLEHAVVQQQIDKGNTKPMFINFAFPSCISMQALSSAVTLLNLDRDTLRDKIVAVITSSPEFLDALSSFVERMLDNPSMEDIPVIREKPSKEDIEKLLEEEKKKIDNKQVIILNDISSRLDEYAKEFKLELEEFKTRVNELLSRSISVTQSSDEKINKKFDTTSIEKPKQEAKQEIIEETLNTVDDWMKKHGII